MGFITYDDRNDEAFDFKNAFSFAPAPATIECGETNDVWINAVRKKNVMELVSKIDGKVTKRVEVDKDFERIAASYGINRRQCAAVRDALR